MIIEEICAKCRYYAERDTNMGACRRYPPSFFGEQTPVEMHRWRFPLVMANSWCGEHQCTRTRTDARSS